MVVMVTLVVISAFTDFWLKYKVENPAAKIISTSDKNITIQNTLFSYVQETFFNKGALQFLGKMPHYCMYQ